MSIFQPDIMRHAKKQTNMMHAQSEGRQEKKEKKKESWRVTDGIRNLLFPLFACVFIAVSKTREDAKFLVLAFPESSEDR